MLSELSKIQFAYLRERMFTLRIALLVAFLVAASYAAGLMVPMLQFPIRVVLAFFLVLQFRLQDDLADRAKDRRLHPERVMSKSESPVPFQMLIGILIFCNLMLLRFTHPHSGEACVLYLLFCLALWIVYEIAFWTKLPDFVRSIFVLSKYPLIVFLLRGDSFNSGIAVLIAVYIIMLIYELAHDPSQRPWPQKRTEEST